MPSYDVAIIGGGPAGSTAGALLRKYGRKPRVLILERETFPRDHVGESQLPAVSRILDEMGCWEAVERADFPIKVGATYKWGKSAELWDFDFYPLELMKDEPRPGRYEGQRRALAFQVDRAVYDEILLDRAAELGCEVRQATRVVKVHRDGDRVTGLDLDGGERVEARWVVDASGHSGILRRAMGVATESPSSLQNVAIWDYWRNAEWAEEIGVGGTRVQVISVKNGWIWFIPLGPDRTSVGLIVPAAYFKAQGRPPADLYADALQEDPRLAGLMERATSEGKLSTTKDWSFLAARHSGENWMLAGESGGFADPILAAGLTITHAAAREAAFTILEADRGEDPAWLRESYDRRQSTRIRNHIRFADFWYTANAQFTDLQDHTRKIALENGLELEPGKAWAWLAQGGFIDEDTGTGIAGFALPLLNDLGGFLAPVAAGSPVYSCNVFELDLEGADVERRAVYDAGRVFRGESYARNGRRLPLKSPYDFWLNALQSRPDIVRLKDALTRHLMAIADEQARANRYVELMPALDAMIQDGWVRASLDPSKPVLNPQRRHSTVHAHEAKP